MVNENYYSGKMLNISEAELMEYINNHSDFQEEAVLAAIWELEKRGEPKKLFSNLKKELSSKNTAAQKEISAATNATNLPLLYTAKYILIFGIFVSVFAAAILMALNLAQLNKKRIARDVIIAGLLYTFLQSYIFNYLGLQMSLLSLPINFLGVYLLDIYFWKKQAPADIKHNKRNIWTPILIVLMLSLPLVYILLKSGGLQP